MDTEKEKRIASLKEAEAALKLDLQDEADSEPNPNDFKWFELYHESRQAHRQRLWNSTQSLNIVQLKLRKETTDNSNPVDTAADIEGEAAEGKVKMPSPGRWLNLVLEWLYKPK